MTTELEPITVVLPSLNTSVELSPKALALVWGAIRRGEASSPEEYIRRRIREHLAECDKGTQTPPSVAGLEQK